MGKMEEIIALGKDNIMNTYAQTPVVFDHGKGAHLYSVDGKCYIDCVAGIAVNALGYGNEKIEKAVNEVLKDGIFHVSNLYYNKWAPKAAAKLNSLAGSKKGFFCNSGAEANEAALKIARKYGSRTGRSRIISFSHSFHGRTYGAMTLTGQEKYQKGFFPVVPDISYAVYNDLDSVKALAGDDVCAVFVEPVQGEGGIVPAEKDFLAGLRKLCDDKDMLLIFDCVQTGLGRTGKIFAFQHYDIKPDVMSLAKALGGGLPFAACLAFDKAADVLCPGEHASTFGGNALSSALCLVVLEELENGLADEAAKKGMLLKKGLEEIAAKHPDKCLTARGLGLMEGLVLKVPPKEVVSACFEKGLLVCSAGYDVLRFVPPLVISNEDISKALEILDEVLS